MGATWQSARTILVTALVSVGLGFATAPLLAQNAEPARFVVLDEDGEAIADAVVTLVPLEVSSADTMAGAKVILDQKGTEFSPSVIAIQVGDQVELQNSDPFGHHVFSFSDAKQFDQLMPAGGINEVVSFETAGVVAVGCNIHDSMRGYIYVAETAYFGQSDAEGRIEIAGVPPGQYTVKPWHSRLRGRPGRYESEIAVTGKTFADGGAVEVVLDLRRGRPGAGKGREKRTY